jgi:hypothetical protein
MPESEEQAKASSQAETPSEPEKKQEKGKRPPSRFGTTTDPMVGKKTQIKKGQRLPGAGRPKKKLVTQLLEKKLLQRLPAALLRQAGFKDPVSGRVTPRKKSTTWGELAVEGVLKEVAKGDVEAFNAVTDRTDGPVAMEISGPEGGPIAMEETIDSTDRLLNLTERIRDRIAKRKSAS